LPQSATSQANYTETPSQGESTPPNGTTAHAPKTTKALIDKIASMCEEELVFEVVVTELAGLDDDEEVKAEAGDLQV